MSLLPYDFSAAIATYGWSRAWTDAVKHLAESGAFHQGDTCDYRALQRALLTEPVTVQHKTRGPITAQVPMALALDLMANLGSASHLAALNTVSGAIEFAFGHDFQNKTHHTFPKDPNLAPEQSGLGALWWLTWAHQPEAIFKSRRRRGGSHTNLSWPNAYFLPAAGFSHRGDTRLQAMERLVDEAIAAAPWLMDNWTAAQGSKNLFIFRGQLNGALADGLAPWYKELKRDQARLVVPADRLIHRAIQSGFMAEQAEDKLDFWDWVYGNGPDQNPSTRLTRAVDGLAFYLSSATVQQQKWLEKVDQYLAEGGQLDSGAPGHAARMAHLEKRYPELHAKLRSHQLDALQRPAPETSSTAPKRQRIRS